MKAEVLTRRTKEPTICLVCQGQAMSVGVCRTNRNGHAVPPYDAWTCVSCARTAKEIVRMDAKDIGLIEQQAMDRVAKATIDHALETYIGALFDAGVRDLSAATDDQVSLAKDAIVVNGAGQEFVRAVVLGFGDEVKAAVERGDAPF